MALAAQALLDPVGALGQLARLGPVESVRAEAAEVALKIGDLAVKPGSFTLRNSAPAVCPVDLAVKFGNFLPDLHGLTLAVGHNRSAIRMALPRLGSGGNGKPGGGGGKGESGE